MKKLAMIAIYISRIIKNFKEVRNTFKVVHGIYIFSKIQAILTVPLSNRN